MHDGSITIAIALLLPQLLQDIRDRTTDNKSVIKKTDTIRKLIDHERFLAKRSGKRVYISHHHRQHRHILLA